MAARTRGHQSVARYIVLLVRREVYELVRRLILSSILAFVQPRTASQVTVGVIVTFVTLLLLGAYSPYAYGRPLFVAYAAYIELFLILFVGLLLKVRPPLKGCSML